MEKIERTRRPGERSETLKNRSNVEMAECNNKRCRLNHSCKRFNPDTDVRFFPAKLRGDKRFCVMYVEKPYED